MHVYQTLLMAISVLLVVTAVLMANQQPDWSCEGLADADGVRGYTSGDGSWTSACYHAVCEDMLGADGVANFTENDTLLAKACYRGTVTVEIEDEWNPGIFTMLTIIAGLIVATAGARLVYVDAQYEKIIGRYQEDTYSLEDDLSKDTGGDADRLMKEWQSRYAALVKAENSRGENRRTGIALDMISVFGIVVLVFMVSLGVITDILALVFLFTVLSVIPATHFLRHLLNVTKRSI